MSELDKNGADWARKAVLTIQTLRTRLQSLEAANSEPIAIIGLGCRFPGAPTPEDFWRLLESGGDAIREVPPERWDLNAYFDPDPNAPGKMYTRQGGFIDEVASFEPQFFGISPREAEAMDPQHRLLLEVSWEALERAGISPRGLAGSRTGVFVGISVSDYMQLLIARGEASLDAHYGVGNALNAAAGRISYTLGLQGPALAIDTACSSSLVAVHEACAALRAGDCSMALAGGVNLILSPTTFIATSRARMLAPDGRCKTFDAAADGFARGEGAGVIILKRLSDARREGDRILAVIRGSAVNQDGASSGLTVPNGAAQEALIRRALEVAGVKPDEVSYVEAHGTGTSLGDPIEVEALATAFSPGRPRERPLRIGSVKTNIGHLESAAGIAGLIKVVLSLEHGVLPAHLHFQKPNPHIRWAELAVQVTTERRDWTADTGRRIAGVSSFGFTGTNAHVLLEEAGPLEPVAKAEAAEPSHHLLTLSGRTEDSLRALARQHADWLQAHPDAELADMGFTLNTGRAHLERRAAIVASSREEALAGLRAVAQGEREPGVFHGEARRRPTIAFLFTGQGSQYAGMGRELYLTQPVFREVIDRCAQWAKGRFDPPFLEVLLGQGTNAALIHQTAYAQPALFALEVALATLWRSLGIEPDIVLGHSVGEYAAACIAGVLPLEEGFSLVCERGRLMQSLPTGGAMLSVLADPSRVVRVLGEVPGVEVAADNGASTVLSGPSSALAQARASLEAAGLRVRPLETSHAFHSAALDPILDPFETFARAIPSRPAELTLISNRTGQPERTFDASYWRRHAREPVQFGKSLEVLAKRGVGLLVEIGPAPVLITLAQQGWSNPSPSPVMVTSLRPGRSDAQSLAEALAALYVGGVTPRFAAFERPWPRRRLALPTYPFDRQRIWAGARPQPGATRSELAPHGVDPLLGRRHWSAASGETVHAAHFEVGGMPFLKDHRVYGSIMVPGATYAAMALRTAGVPCRLSGVLFHEPMLLEEEAGRDVQFALAPAEGAGRSRRFKLLSGTNGETGADWVLHAEGQVAPLDIPPPVHESMDALRSRLQARDPQALFAEYAALGVELGPTFRSIQKLWTAPGEAFGELVVPPALGAKANEPLHPAVLDACTQLARAAIAELSGTVWSEGFFAPFEYRVFELYAPVPRHFFCRAVRRDEGRQSAETLSLDLTLFDEDGLLLGALKEFVVKRAPREAMLRGLRRMGAGLEYELRWYEQTGRGPVAVPGWLGDFARVGAEVERRAAELSAEAGLERLTALARPLEALALEYVLVALRNLGWELRAGERVVADEQAARLGVSSAHRRLFKRLLDVLVEEGIASPEPDGISIRSVPSPSEPTPEALLRRFPDARIELTVIARCGERLAAVLRGEVDPLGLLFPRDGSPGAEQLYRDSPGPKVLNHMAGEAIRAAVADLPPRRMLRVLEIGAGTGGTTACVLPMLPAERTVYTYTDISPAFFAKAEERFARFGCVTYRALDIEREPLAQGFATQSFDVVIAANVLHATVDLSRAVEHVRTLLAPGGLLLLIEGTRPRLSLDLIFGLLPGWWRFNDTLRQRYPLLATEAWSGLLRSRDFTPSAAFSTPEGALGQHLMLARAPADGHLSMEPPRGSASTWLVFTDSGGLGEQLARRLEARGQRAVRIERGAAYAELGSDRYSVSPADPDGFEKVLDRGLMPGSELGGVLFLWALDASTVPADDASRLMEGVQLGAGGALHLARALVVRDRRPASGLLLVTRGAQATEEPRPLALAQSPVWGLGRVITLEHPELGCRLLDLAAEVHEDELEPLLAELLAPDTEEQLALRNGSRWVPRLARVESRGHEPAALSREASYLITGGLGGLGLEVARWMSRRGARHLVLMGRSPPGPGSEPLLTELRASGTTVRIALGDVSREDDVRRVLDEIATSLPPLRGIIHAAGVLSDAVLTNQSWARFETVLAPKVLGAFHLHQLTQGTPLDFFVLFSSWVGLLGASGQANHAAANAFLDALAHHRRALGQPAISIDWGGWSQVGAVARRAIEARLAENGVGTIAPSAAIAILEQLLADRPVQVGVIPVDWEIFIRQFRGRRAPALLDLLVHAARGQRAEEGGEEGALARRFREARPEERVHLLLTQLQGEVARVLRLGPGESPPTDQPLFEIGMDSLMALELRNRLQTQLGQGVHLPSTLVFEFPTVAALAAHLETELGLQPGGPAPTPPAPAQNTSTREPPPEAPLELENMSLDQLGSLLDARLSALEPKGNDV